MRAVYKQPSAATKARKAANGGMNDTEVAFAEHLKKRYVQAFEFEPETLILPGGVKYTPDFRLCIHDGTRIYFEVKGSKRTKPSKRYPMGKIVPVCTEVARLRLKFAAAAYPRYRFIMTWPNRGEWMEKEYSAAVGAGRADHA